MRNRLLNRQISLLSIMPIKSILKIRNQQIKEKVSGPDPLNHDYIHYSDIQIANSIAMKFEQ